MRRLLILTVTATVAMVLLAMLVPMAVLIRNYAVEDRLSQAGLEVQAAETVVSRQDKGAVSVYLDRVNRDSDSVQTTVLYPDGTVIGPGPGADDLVAEARRSGRARVDDVAGGAQILVPVSLGGGADARTPVIRLVVRESAVSGPVHRAWLVLGLLGLAILVGAVLLADRLGRSFVRPIRTLAETADHLGDGPTADRAPVSGPPEVQSAARALNRLVDRVETLLERERAHAADLSHRLRTPITALRLAVDGVADREERRRLDSEVDRLEAMVDGVVREASRSSTEGLVATCDARRVTAERVHYWSALAEEQGRDFSIDVPDHGTLRVAVAESQLVAVIDVLLDNVFTHTEDDVAVTVSLAREPGGVLLVVADGGPGLPPGLDVVRRGASGAGSSGLGLAIVQRTAQESGGELQLRRSVLGGAEVSVLLGTDE